MWKSKDKKGRFTAGDLVNIGEIFSKWLNAQV